MLVAGLTAALSSIEVEQHTIDRVIAALEDCTAESWGERFASGAPIALPSLGRGDRADELGLHHDRAQQVMAETVHGIIADLTAFATGVRQAAGMIRDADDATAEELVRAQRAVEMMNDAWVSSEGDAAYDRARNEQRAQA
jgi:hypothetical protein